MKSIRHIVGYLVLATLLGCSQNDVFVPDAATLSNTTPIARATLRAMEGIYTLSSGASGMGEEFVCLSSMHIDKAGKQINRVSFFSSSRGIFFILDAGEASDGSIQLAGFWRVSETTSNGSIGFTIPKDKGASELLNSLNPADIKMTGAFTSTEGKQNLEISYSRDFSSKVKSRPLAIFAHHGVMTNSNPPFIENSLDVFRHAMEYGANSVETDVRLTKDNVPMLYHDPDLNTRVLQKNGILANLNEVDSSILQNFVRLIDGQRVPTMREALELAIDSTELKYVWLDIKGNPDVFKYLQPIIRNAIARAEAKNRDITIITDIPSAAVLDEYLKQPDYIGVPLMYEPDLETAIKLGAGFWGPRWTLGTLNSDVAKAHSLGMKVFTWTTNSEKIIVDYLNDGDFDGFITDYPALLIYHYYTR